jgi:signal transduction histidine kinase/CheY-like chemotaxis protein
VPIRIRGTVYGNLYLAEKEGGAEFTEDDEEFTILLAGQAGAAIENARLYESGRAWSRQLESLHEIFTALAGELDIARLLRLVARRLRELVDARLVTIALPSPRGGLRIEVAEGEEAGALVGMQLDESASKHARVLERRQTQRVDSTIDDPEVDQVAVRRAGITSELYVPLLAQDRPLGVLAAHDKQGRDPRFADADVRLAEIFAGRAAAAIDLSQRVARDALRRVVEAQELERRRVALELHDQTGQELTSALLGLKAVEEAPTSEARALAVAELRELLLQTLQDVRRLAVDLRPKALDDFGLVPAVERLAGSVEERTGIKVEVEARLPARLPERVETALYRIVQEALTNVVKYARAETVSIVLARRDDIATAIIEDDGRGFDPTANDGGGLGLTGMRERLTVIDGRLEIESGPGAGNLRCRPGAALVSVRVLIVDDHAVVRTGLRCVLEAEEDIEPVAEAGSAKDAAREARFHQPDVVLMDVVLPGQSGIDATPDVLRAAPEAKVLVLSMQDDRATFARPSRPARAATY